jgi:hypothetical protein
MFPNAQMSIKQIIEAKLRHPVDMPRSAKVPPTCVWRISYTTSKEIAITSFFPSDTAIYFEGLYCPFGETSLLVERDVAVDWGLISRKRSSDAH